MNEDERKFIEECRKYDPALGYDEYVDLICKCLTLSDWNYSEEGAAERVRIDASYIRELYDQKEPVWDAMIDVGYCCG